ncbi:MAG: phage tail sheath subtilisin-like domain-containing protein [Oscillospiraceae bacterium]|jgi:hypothetical protein|nr:phage tail sheath subtilisin-like domain-containing protein [Oscillospiraceae bacterium]
MASIFTIGEQKKRPGVYFSYTKDAGARYPGIPLGNAAVLVKSDFGALGQVERLKSYKDAIAAFRDGGTVDVIRQIFLGGAKAVYAVRVGSGGTAAAYSVLDSAETAVATLSTKFPSTRTLTVSIQDSIVNDGTAAVTLYDGTAELERIVFGNGAADSAANLIAAVNTKSRYLSAVAEAASANAIAEVSQDPFTAGAAVTTATQDYANALDALVQYDWTVAAVDTTDSDVTALLVQFAQGLEQNGRFALAVIGCPPDNDISANIAAAKSVNSHNSVVVGAGFTDIEGGAVTGAYSAARIAGIIAATPSNASVTHKVLADAADITGTILSSDYESAIDSGLLLLSRSASGEIWIESGITSLSSPHDNEDGGWKKIKRTMIRFELMTRLGIAVDALVGQVNNDNDGIATVLQEANGVIGAMVSENKLKPGSYVELSADTPPTDDSAWFNVYANDVDSLEKLYFLFSFNYGGIA